MIDHKKLPFVEWCRDDYARIEGNDDEWLLNPKWKIRPAIAFINRIPKVLTCQDHNNGSSNKFIHSCRWKHNLPCDQPDQIAQVVTQSRTIKRGRASAYSTEWQMYEQRGTFSGLDTCNHVEFGKFDRHSVLRHEIEDRSISNRFDVKLHLNNLCESDVISKEMAKDMTESAEYYNTNNDLKKYYYGATYIPIEAAIAFQQDAIDRSITLNIPNRNSNQNGISIKFSRY